MPTTLLSVLARLSAGALLFQATAPAIAPLKKAIDDAQARSDDLATLRDRASLPPKPMKGVPQVQPKPSVAPGPEVASHLGLRPEGTILDEVGRTFTPTTTRQRAAWRSEVQNVRTTTARRSWLLLWLAEADLAREYPQMSVERIDTLLQTRPSAIVEGIARHDRAECLFYMGRYGEARRAFETELLRGDVGFDRRQAALWVRHASACEGYHLANASLGIPNPLRLDPLCGASAVAVCLRALGLPHGRDLMGRTVRHTGEGSNLQDLVDSCERLGAAANPLQATEKGLRRLPLPAVAYVEGDHFVAVVAADKSGVEYVCSDCGRWPGGPIRVSWRAWRAMKPGVFLAVTRRGSPQRAALESIAPQSASGLPVRAPRAVDVSIGVTQGRLAGAASRLAATLAGNVLPLYLPVPLFVCGQHPESSHCPSSADEYFGCGGDLGPACPIDKGGFSSFGALGGDPVNLATGEEEYRPSPDLMVYNPLGPSVSWRHIFNSLSSYGSGFGYGWSHPYNVGVAMQAWNSGGVQTDGAKGGQTNGISYPGYPATGYVVFDNGARIAFSASEPPTSQKQTINCTVSPGVRMMVQWKCDAGSTYDWLEVTFANRTKWVVGAPAFTDGSVAVGSSTFRPIRQVVDRNGRWIGFNYGSYSVPNGYGSSWSMNRLTGIVDSAGASLLALAYDANGLMTSASDRYGRHVDYTTASFKVSSQPSNVRSRYDELTSVSQIAASGSIASARATFGYTPGPVVHVGNVAPYLNSISVPSPAGSGMATGYIYYADTYGFVASSTDANGNRHVYLPTDWDGSANSSFTTVKVLDPQGNLVRQCTYGLDSTMGWTILKDAQGRTIVSKAYGGASPYRPSSVTDGNNRIWGATYDSTGNRLTMTTPKGTVTTSIYDTSHFALGELTSIQEGSKTPTLYTYYEPSGLLQEIDNPVPGGVGTGSIQATTFAYDAVGNLTRVLSPGNNTTVAHSITYGYTTDGTYSQTEALGRPITITDSNNKVWHLRYDARGNLASRWDPLNNEWDSDHNLADQTTVCYAPGTGTSGSGRSAAATTYLYVGGPATKIDAKSESGATIRTTSLTYGPEGETLVRSGSCEAAAMTYDASYCTKTLKDGNNATTTFTIDTSGHVTEIDYPGATGANFDRVHFTGYDPVGNLLSRTDGNGQVTNYTYGDTDGLLSSVAYPGAAASNVTLGYDVYDRLTGMADAVGASSLSYDDLSEVVSSTRTYTGLPAQAFSYTYYPDGARQTMVNPAGTWSYSYDGDGRYSSLTSPAGTSSATYLDNGWQSTRTLPNGASSTYGYKAAGMLYDVLTRSASTAQLSEHKAYNFDGVFNVTYLNRIVNASSSLTGQWHPAYDSKDRLTGETSTIPAFPASTSHAYDAAGNPTTLRGTTLVYNSDNQLTTGSLYDGNGNPTTYRGSACVSDPENRTTTVGALTSGYRADGLRAWKSSGGAKTYFLYDEGEPVVELDATGAVKAVDVYASDGLVAQKSAGSWTQYTFDLQGSVSQRLSSTGTVLSSSAYDGYGVESSSGATPTDSFGFNAASGYYFDRETGLYRCGHRYYDPGAGRWINRDPAGTAGGINVYGYCASGPVGSSDPSGYARMPNRGGYPGKICDYLDDPDPCRALLEAIKSFTKQLQKRRNDLLADPAGLYFNPQPSLSQGGKGSYDSHMNQYQMVSSFLQDLYKAYALADCDPNDPDFQASTSWFETSGAFMPSYPQKDPAPSTGWSNWTPPSESSGSGAPGMPGNPGLPANAPYSPGAGAAPTTSQGGGGAPGLSLQPGGLDANPSEALPEAA